MTTKIKFIYFDLGNVILHFDNGLICPQLAEVAGVSVERVQQFFNEHDYQMPLECGERSFDEVYDHFCADTESRPAKADVERAVSDIFKINAPVIPIVSRLSSAGIPLGILSNTSDVHWRFITNGRYGLLPDYFDRFALSFEIGKMKPDAHIYAEATKIAGEEPASIFFTDDRPENVQGAIDFGFDAVLFEGPLQLTDALVSRGVRFNY